MIMSQPSQRRMARLSMQGRQGSRDGVIQAANRVHRLFHWALGLHWSQRLGIKG